MKKFTIFVAIITIVLAGSLAIIQPAAAQTETPTPTLETSSIIEMDGQHFKLDYTITLGDMAVVIVGLFLATVLTIFVITRIVTIYLI